MKDIESHIEEVRYMFVRRFHDDKKTVAVVSRAAVLAGFGLPAEEQPGGLKPATLNESNQAILSGLIRGYFGEGGEQAVRACLGVLCPSVVVVPVEVILKTPIKRKTK
jgi:hypothetical protein